MTAPIYANTPADFTRPYCNASFIAADGTKAKVVVFPQSSAAAADPSPLRYGGAALIGFTASSSDGTARDFRIWFGNKISYQDALLTGTINTTASTLVRANTASSDWIREGWRPGMRLMVFAPQGSAENAAVDGIPATVTAVTASTLTVDGAPFAVLAALASGSLICAVTPRFVVQVPVNAGNTNAIPNVGLIANANDKSVLTKQWYLGADSLLIAQPLAAVSALPAVISFDAAIARY